MINVSEVTGSSLQDTLEAWATSERQKLLVIDEANLAPNESLALLKEIFATQSITINGKRHRLSPDHKLLFTGNYDSFLIERLRPAKVVVVQ
jgi:MoxR-like ATPase